MSKKSYPLSNIGYAQFLLDIKQRKERRTSLVLSVVILFIFLGFGWLSKSLLILFLVNAGASELAHILF